MLQEAVQSNLEKDRLLRGTEDLIEVINTQLELTQVIIEDGNKVRKPMPSRSGTDTVYERMKRLAESC